MFFLGQGAFASAAAAAFGNLLQGWDSGVIAGALLYLVPDFHLEKSPQLTGAVVAATLSGAFLSTAVAGPASDAVGRRRVLVIAACIYTVAAATMAFSPTLTVLIISRSFVGVGIGLISTVVPVYIAECSEASERGRLATLPQLLGSSGLVLSYAAVFTFSLSETASWRLMLGSSLIPAVIYLCLTVLLPESPRWLVSKGRLKEARHILQHLRCREDVTAELSSMLEGLDVGVSPLEEWLIKPEEAGHVLATIEESTTEAEAEAAARRAMEEAAQKSALEAAARLDVVPEHLPDIEAPLIDLESIPPTPIFEQTTIFSTDWANSVPPSPKVSGAPRMSSEDEHGPWARLSEFARQRSGTSSMTTEQIHAEALRAEQAAAAAASSGKEEFSDAEMFGEGPSNELLTGQATPPKQTQTVAEPANQDVMDSLMRSPVKSPAILQVPSYTDLAGRGADEAVKAVDGTSKPEHEHELEEANDGRWHCRHCGWGHLHLPLLSSEPSGANWDKGSVASERPVIEDLKTGEKVELVDTLEPFGAPVVLGSRTDEEGNEQELLVQKLGPTTAAAVPAEVLDQKPTVHDFKEPGVRRALMVGVIIQIIQQAAGINAVLYFTPVILIDSGAGAFFESTLGISSRSSSILGTGLSYVLMLPSILRAMTLMDRSGRRQLLLSTLPILTVALVVLALSSSLLQPGVARAAFSLGSVALYVCSFVMGMGPVPGILCSEIFPTRVRGVCIGICLAVQWLVNIAVSQSFPVLRASVGLPVVFGMYVVVCVVGWFFIYSYVPETKGLTLEEVCDTFTKASQRRNKGELAVHPVMLK